MMSLRYQREQFFVINFRTLRKKMEKVEWKRAQDIDDRLKMIVDGVKPQDIVQGDLYNAYFLSAVAAIAEYQVRIRRLLVQNKTQESRVYGIGINQLANWQIVVVDDYFPLINDNGQERLLGANCVENELWVLFLEKAYAKIFGNYENIGKGGNVSYALTDLTGAPSEIFYLNQFLGDGDKSGIEYYNAGGINLTEGNVNLGVKQGDDFLISELKIRQRRKENREKYSQAISGEEALWELLKNSDINKYIMCTGSKKPEDIGELYAEELNSWKKKNPKGTTEEYVIGQLGILPSYCYTLLDVAMHNGEKLVRLRNSKCQIEWTGDWGDNSPKWQQIEEEYRTEIKSDGIFYLPFSDFNNLFEFICINYYDDTYIHTAFKDKLEKNTMICYDLNISTPGNYFINVSQKDLRLGDRPCKL